MLCTDTRELKNNWVRFTKKFEIDVTIYLICIFVSRLSALIKFDIFAVQECTTDSEELIYQQVRASSSCSAPPDLLLVSDRENNLPLRSGMVTSVNKLVTPPSTCTNTCPVITSSNNNQKNSHRDQPIHKQSSSSYNGSNDSNGKLQQKNVCHRLLSDTLDNDIQVDAQHNSSAHRSHHQQRSEEHIRLEVSRCCLNKMASICGYKCTNIHMQMYCYESISRPNQYLVNQQGS